VRITDPELGKIVDDFVAESTGDVVVVSDADGGLVWVSPSAERIMGWDGSDLTGRSAQDFLHGEDLPTLLELRAQYEASAALLRIRRFDGSFMWCRVFSRPLHGDNGEYRGRVSVFRDASVEVESRRALADSEEWYRLLVENVTDFVTMASPDGKFTWASASLTRVMGWQPEEVLGQVVVSYLHPHDVPGLLELREQMAEGRTSILRARALRADGTYRWLELSVKPIFEGGELVGRLTAYRDVQAEVEAQERLAKSERLFRMLAENATDVVAYADDGLLAWVSPSVTAALGWEPAEMLGKSLIAYAHPSDVTNVAAQQSIAMTETSRRRFRLRNRNGEFNWVESHAGPYRDAAGDGSGWVTSFRVIDDIVRAEEVLDRRARYDALTGLLNRQEVFERLEAEGRRTGQEIAVMFCDVDRLKEINDTHGHAAGDEVLRAVADRARAVLRGDDIVGRIGGDEFFVVLRGVHGIEEARAKGEDVRRVVAESVALAEGTYSPSVSIGVTLARPDEAIDCLIARADDAMYEAKNAGRDRVVAF